MRELSKEEIAYIDQNIGKISARKISRHLHIDKRIVERQIARKNALMHPKPQFIAFFENAALKIRSSISPAGVLALIVLVTCLLRLIYIVQLRHTPFAAPFKGGLDDYVFDAWALDILKGNWLGDKIIYIYRMPLYVYLLAAIYFLFGHHYWIVYVIQVLLGSATIILVYLIGKEFFGKPTALIAAALTAFYGPFMFYTGTLLGETLGVFLFYTSILFLVRFQRLRASSMLFFSGILFGLSMLTRGNMLVVLPFVCLWLALSSIKERAFRAIKYISIFLLGVIISLSPIIIRNYIAEKDIVPITAIGGLNLYVGNGADANGKYRLVKGVGTDPKSMIEGSIEVAEKSAGRKLKPSEVSDYWVSETIKYIKGHNAASFFSLLFKKLAMTWNAYEIPDIWDYYFFKEFIPILRLPLVGFFIIAPFAFAGIYLAWPRRRDCALLYLIIAGYLFSLIAVFVASRYRVYIVPALAIFAAWGMVEGWRVIKTFDKKIMLLAICLIAGSAITLIDFGTTGFETSYNSLGIILKREGKTEAAIDAYNKAIKLAPKYPSPYYNLGILYRDTDKPDLAATYFKKSLEADPNFAPAKRELGE